MSNEKKEETKMSKEFLKQYQIQDAGDWMVKHQEAISKLLDLFAASKDKQLSEFTNQILEQNKEIEGLKNGSAYKILADANQQYVANAIKDREEIASLKSQLSQLIFEIADKNEEIQKINQDLGNIKSQPDSKGGYGELLEWIEKMSHERMLTISVEEIKAKILSLSSIINVKITPKEAPLEIWANILNPAFPHGWALHATEKSAVINANPSAKTHRYIHESLLPSKEESKAGFSEEEVVEIVLAKHIKDFYPNPDPDGSDHDKNRDGIRKFVQSLTPPTSKIEAKPSQQEGEKKTAEEILAEEIGVLKIDGVKWDRVSGASNKIISAMKKYANQFRLTDSKEAVELTMCPACCCKHSNKDYEGYCCQSCFDGISR